MSINYNQWNRQCEICAHFMTTEKIKGFKKFRCAVTDPAVNDIGRDDYLGGKIVHCLCLGEKFKMRE